MNLKRDLSFAILVLAVIGVLYYLSTKTKIKKMPGNQVHLSSQTRDDCMKCHTADTLGTLEIQHKHPGKWKDARVACTLCHKPGPAVKAQLAPADNPPTQDQNLSMMQMAQSLHSKL